MAEDKRHIVVRGAHRGGLTDWRMVEVGAMLTEKIRAQSERRNRKAEPVRPRLIDQIARVRAEG